MFVLFKKKNKKQKTMSRVFSCLKGNERNDFPGEKNQTNLLSLLYISEKCLCFFSNIHFEFPFSGLEIKRSLLKTVLAYSSDTTRVTEIQCNMF